MRRLLIAEGVSLNRDLLNQLLEDKYHLLMASDGAEGLALAKIERPDLILMDLSLTKIDGWEVTRPLKANAALRHIPIIALTAYAMAGDEQKAQAHGCDDSMSKPLDEEILSAMIAYFLDQPATR